MRIGVNPEKKKKDKIRIYRHRVIIPVYIPESEELYFKNLFEVLKVSLDSLFKTIDSNETKISIINNSCKSEVTDYLNDLLVNRKIDKHILFAQNYGKIYTVLSEAKASVESYITIADADVFFMNNWEARVFEVLNNFDKAGVVSPQPSPHLTYYNNYSLFGNFFTKVKRGNIVKSKSFKLFEDGINNDKIFDSNKYNWKQNQFYLEKNDIKACVGSGHFVATYKNIFKKLPSHNPKYVFRAGDENIFIDTPFDQLGFYRLSTIDSYVYHLGNKVPNWVIKYEHLDQLQINIREKIHLKFTKNTFFKLKVFFFKIKYSTQKIRQRRLFKKKNI